MKRIDIIGAGIGGLAAAALLARAGHQVQVFDTFDSPRPVGSGLVIQPVGQAVLRAAGALDAALAYGQKITRMSGHEADSKRMVLDVSYDRFDASRFGLAIHRAALFEALLQAATRAGAVLIPGHQAVSASDAGIRFANGRRADGADLVIDASGVHSPVSPLKARPLPYGAIWGTVPWPAETALPQTGLSQCYRRASRMIGALPIGTLPGCKTPQAAIFWSLPRDSYADWQATPLEQWKAEAIGLWPAFAPFLENVSRHSSMTMARYAHGTLRYPVQNGVAIIGDAAHRASPQLGQGANMALLDALALCRAVDRHPGPDALHAYALARRWHVRLYQLTSWAFTPQYQSDSRALPMLRDHVLMPLSQVSPLPRVLSRLVGGDLLPPLGSLGPLGPLPLR